MFGSLLKDVQNAVKTQYSKIVLKKKEVSKDQQNYFVEQSQAQEQDYFQQDALGREAEYF
jgi:hypothetical protein